jgi:hypothetical protein
VSAFDRTQADTYAAALWSGREGHAVLAFGRSGHVNDAGRYDHKTWDEVTFAWPTEAGLMLDEIARLLAAEPNADVYVCPLLRTEPKRRKGNAAHSDVVWVDADELGDLTRLDGLGTFVVGSGSNGHGHVYLRLTEDVGLEERAALAKELAARVVKADPKWADNDVLRLPGTVTGKTDPPTSVRFIIPPDNAWRLAPDDARKRLGATPAVSPRLDAVALPAPVREALTTSTGDRSADHQRLVRACYTAGLTSDQTRSVVRSYAPSMEKYGRRVDEETVRSYLKCVDDEQGVKFWIPLSSDNPQPVEQQDASAEDAYRRAIATEAHRLRIQRDAKRIITAEDRPPVRKPEVLTLRERLAKPRPLVRWRIDAWQPADSRVMVAAQFKAGKTTLVANLVRSLVDGDYFLGAHTTTPIDGTAVVLDFEMGEHQLDSWYAAQKIRNDDLVVVIPLRGSAATFDILDAGVRAQWAEMLRSRACRYLIVDCLRPILDALGLDEHREAGRFLTTFDALLAETGISESAVIHHMGHTAERSRGDSRIRDWPDVEWRLVREDDDPGSPRYIAAYGRDVDMPEGQLDYAPGDRRLTLTGGTRKDAAVQNALIDVLKLLKDSAEKLSGRQIEEQVEDHSRQAIRGAIKAGINEGSILTEPGPRRSTLHFSAPVRQSAPPVRQRSVSECASASIDGALTAHPVRIDSAPKKTGRPCTICDAPDARAYPAGWRCDAHRPGAERESA